MNPTRILLRLGLAVGAACALPSCEVYEGYPGGGYASAGYASGGGYYDNENDYDDDFYEYRPAYTAFAVWGPTHSYYYGGHYYSHAWWYDEDYRRYSRERAAHYAHRGSSHGSGHHGEPVKLVHYRENDPRRVPSGYHAPEYYKEHGFSLKQNTYKDREGDVHGHQPQSNSIHRDNDQHSSNSSHGSDHSGSSGFSRYSHPTQDSNESSKKKEHSSSSDSDEHHHKNK